MPRASRGFGDCHVQRSLGTGAQGLRQSVPYTILSVSTNSWVVMETQPAQREPPPAPVTHPALRSHSGSRSGHTTQQRGRGTGRELPSNLLARTGFLPVLQPQPHSTGASSSLEKGREAAGSSRPGRTGLRRGQHTLDTDIRGHGVNRGKLE